MCQPLPMAWPVSHEVLLSPVAAYAGIQTGEQCFIVFFYVSIHVFPAYRFIWKQPHLLNSHVHWLSMCFCYWEGIIIVLPFMATTSIMANSCLMGHYFCILVLCHLLCGQPCMIYALRSSRCFSWAVASCMDMHTSSSIVLIVLNFMLRCHISLFLFFLWLWLDSQYTIYSLGLGLYNMCTLYCYMHRIMYWRHCDGITTSLPINTTNSLWSMMICISHAKQKWWNFSNPCRIQSTSLCCWIIALHWIGSCWEMWWVKGLCCLVLHHICNLGCPLPAVGQHPGLLLMCQFPNIMSSWHHSISCTHLLLIMIWLFHICLTMLSSMSVQVWQTSTSEVVCICPQLLVRMHSDSILYPGMTTVLIFWVVAYPLSP